MKNYLGYELPDHHFLINDKCTPTKCSGECDDEGECTYNSRFDNHGKPYIIWTDFWEMAETKFGVSPLSDVLHQSQAQRREFHLFRARGPREWRSIPMEIWMETRPADMGPISRELSDAWNAYRESEEYKSLIPPYRNLWHLILDKVWSGHKFTRDGFNLWPSDFFDLKKWPSWAWPQIMFLDQMTHGHPARDSEGVNFFIYW